MAATSVQYSDEKILIDPTAPSEKVASAEETGNAASSEKETVASDAPEAVSSSVYQDREEKEAVALKQPEDLKTSNSRRKQDTLAGDASEKQPVSPEDLSSPADHPPSYISPTRTSSSSPFPSNQARSYREYSYYHAAPWRPTHNIIVDPENCARYFIEVSEFRKGKQDVSVRDVRSSDAQYSAKRENLSVDEGKSCPVVAFAQYPHGTNDQVRIGVGNPDQMGTVRWVQMSRAGPTEPWCIALKGAKDEEKRFEWRSGRAGSTALLSRSDSDAAPKVSDSPADSSSATPIPGVMHFVDCEKGEVVAMYTELKVGRSLKKRGKLRVYEHAVADVSQFEKDVELLIMLSVGAMNEKRRRKTWKKWALLGAG